MLATYLKREWFGNVRGDVLAGVVVALALIPEAIAFSIIAGVDPAVSLYTSFCIALTIAFVGGRPGMISAATGAMALLMVTLVRDYGLEYLFAATILTGVFQILFGVFKLGRYLKFVPRGVMIGFVNALAILIFLAQLPKFVGANWQMYAFVSAFDPYERVERVVIDLTHAHIWDGSAIAALDKVMLKFMKRGTEVTLLGQNEANAALIACLAVYDKPGALERTASH